MKKKDNSFNQSFLPVKINMDDIIQILEIFESNCENVKIDIDDYIVNDKNELYTIPKDVIKKLEIQTSNPYFHLEFDKSLIRFYMAESSMKNRGVFDAIRDIIKNNKVKSWNLLRLQIFPILLMSLSIYISFGLIKINNNNIKYIITIVGLLVSFIWIKFYQNIRYDNYSRIYIKNNKSNSNIFVRKRDDIIIAIISGIIGLVTGFLLK